MPADYQTNNFFGYNQGYGTYQGLWGGLNNARAQYPYAGPRQGYNAAFNMSGQPMPYQTGQAQAPPYQAQRVMPPYQAQQAAPPYQAQRAMPPYQAAQSQAPPPRMATPQEMGITYEPIESLFGGAAAGGTETSGVAPAGVAFGGAAPRNAGPWPGRAQIPSAGKAAARAVPSNGAALDAARPKEVNPGLAFSEDIKTALGNFAQNERNGSVFYSHLSNVAGDEKKRRLLADMADTSRRHSQDFAGIYKLYANEEFNVKETQIDTRPGFAEGVKWALREESQAIRELAGLYEAGEMEAHSRRLTVIMNRKIGDLGILMGLI